jgi:hypothetical protein
MTRKVRRTTNQPTARSRIHAYVATPAYDGRVMTDYAVSLAESCQLATMLGIKVTCAVMGNGAFIDLARCTFINMFLDSEATHLFFIDADLNWEARAFVALLQADYDVSCGVYPRRQKDPSFPVHWVQAEEGGLSVVNGGWLKVDRAPTGFLCIRRHVIEKMVEKAKRIRVQYGDNQWHEIPQLFYTFINDDGKFVGEDFAWSRDYCEQFNDVIYCWPDFDFKHGGYEGNFHTWLNEQVEKEEAEDAKIAELEAANVSAAA